MNKVLSHLLLITVVVILALTVSLKTVFAAVQYQVCYQGGSCEVGEFLYDDSYVPIASATCTLTSRYPDGTLFINAAPLTGTSDGWYSEIIEATGSAGLYRSQLCCTSNDDYLCLDKSFTIEASSSASGSSLTTAEIADAVWDEPRSSHTQSGSFGEAVQNIIPSASQIAEATWGYSSRNLTGFGGLISDMWGYSTRTITSSTTSTSILDPLVAKKSDVDDVKKEVLYNQALLEKLANKPIIQNYLEEDQEVNLQTKLEESQYLLSTLLINTYSMESKLGSLNDSWVNIENEKLLSTIQEVADANTAINDSAVKFNTLWEIDLAKNVSSQSETFKKRIKVIEDELTLDEKSRDGLLDIRNLRGSVNEMISQLGTANDTVDQETLFGKIRQKKEIADRLESYSSDANKLLAEWEKLKPTDIQQQTNTISQNVEKVNQLPKARLASASNANESQDKKLKNRVLSIQGTIQANKKLLAKKSNTGFSSSWLEEGSVIFKTLLTNPSTKISQSVPLKYYLPAEVMKEDIISVDDGLKVNYDVDKKQMYVEGEFNMSPSETKVVSVRVEDIWIISEESIETLRTQVEELSKPLAKTSYFGQSVTIKSNINVTLDKILQNQKTAITPEAKIKNYYEAQIELTAVKDQISKLEDLVAQSGSILSLAGFVGGAQVIAVWGLIIIMVTGFVFLVIYMRVLRGKELQTTSEAPEEKPLKKKRKTDDEILVSSAQKNDQKGTKHRFGIGQIMKFMGVIVLFSAVTSGITGLAVYSKISRTANTSQPQATSQITEEKESVDEGTVMGEATESATASPSTTASVSATPSEIEKASDSAKTEPEIKKLVVKETPTRFLNVRSKPSLSSEVVTQVYPGDTFEFTDIVNGWYKITLSDAEEGWISGVYIRVLIEPN